MGILKCPIVSSIFFYCINFRELQGFLLLWKHDIFTCEDKFDIFTCEDNNEVVCYHVYQV